MYNLLYILKSLSARYQKYNSVRMPSSLVYVMLQRELVKLSRILRQSNDEDFINFRSSQGRSDHENTSMLQELDKRTLTLLKEFDKTSIMAFRWTIKDYRFVANALRSTIAAIPYYKGEKDIKAFTTYHNPELLIFKTLFNIKLICYSHGAILKQNNIRRKFPLEAGCDELHITYKEDSADILTHFNDYLLPQPNIIYQKKYVKKNFELIDCKRIVYLQTIYKNINPALDLIKLRMQNRNIKYQMHPRSSSNKIKIIFYFILSLILGGRVQEDYYRKDTLYISNGSTALLNALKQECAVAFYSPTKKLKNPYQDYMEINDYENQ